MSESSDGKSDEVRRANREGEEHDKYDKKSKVHDLAQSKAAKLVKTRLEGGRPRSKEGVPVEYTTFKDSVDPEDVRNSRSISDPQIPGNLVIYDAKGLFSDQTAGVMNDEANKMTKLQTIEERPKFFDPVFQSKAYGTNTLRTKFEAVQTKPCNTGDEFLSHFENPLHNSNGKLSSDVAESLPNTAPELPPKLKKSAITKPLPEIRKKKLPEIPNSQSCEVSKKQPPEVPKKPVLSATKNQEPGKKPPVSKKPEVLKKPHFQKMVTNNNVAGIKNEQISKIRGDSDPLPLASTVTIATATILNAVPEISEVAETKCDDEVANNDAKSSSAELPDENVHKVDDKSVANHEIPNGDAVECCKTADDKGANWDSDNEPIGNQSDFDDDGESGEEDDERRISLESSDLVFPDSKSKKLYNIALEILTTERAYVRRLHLLDQVFHAKLDAECREKGLITSEALSTIFGNIKAIHQLHDNFLLPKLEDRMKQWGQTNRIGDILKTLAPFLKLYTYYIGNFDKASETVGVWMKKCPKFAAVIDGIQKSPECENLTLHHHMLEPIQRIPRYKMLLTDYLSKLPEDSTDMKDTKDALAIISESATHANESMKRTDKFKKLLDIQDKLGENFHVITASREFVKEGDLFKVSARTGVHHQPRTLILFSDVLLCCSKVPATNKYKVKVSMDLYGMKVCTVDDDVADENTFRVSSKQKVIDFAAGSVEEQQEWVECLQKTIVEQEQKKNSYRRANKLEEILTDSELGKKAPAWVRDESVSMCMSCDAIFTALRRRHHCRACGRVLCGKCSQFRAPLDYDGGKQNRVCTKCYQVLVKGVKEEDEKEDKPKNILKIDQQSNVQMSGYLSYKHGGEKSWQKRWFVLLDNFVLYCHKAKKDTKAVFSLPLPGYTVDKPTLADDVDKKNVIKLHHKNMRVYFFEGEDESSLKRWVNFLSFAVRAELYSEEQEESQLESSKGTDEVDVTII